MHSTVFHFPSVFKLYLCLQCTTVCQQIVIIVINYCMKFFISKKMYVLCYTVTQFNM